MLFLPLLGPLALSLLLFCALGVFLLVEFGVLGRGTPARGRSERCRRFWRFRRLRFWRLWRRLWGGSLGLVASFPESIRCADGLLDLLYPFGR